MPSFSALAVSCCSLTTGEVFPDPGSPDLDIKFPEALQRRASGLERPSEQEKGDSRAQKQFTHDGANYTARTNETTDPAEVAIFDGNNDKVHSLTALHETLSDMP